MTNLIAKYRALAAGAFDSGCDTFDLCIYYGFIYIYIYIHLFFIILLNFYIESFAFLMIIMHFFDVFCGWAF